MSGFNATMLEMTYLSINSVELTNFHKEIIYIIFKVFEKPSAVEASASVYIWKSVNQINIHQYVIYGFTMETRIINKVIDAQTFVYK